MNERVSFDDALRCASGVDATDAQGPDVPLPDPVSTPPPGCAGSVETGSSMVGAFVRAPLKRLVRSSLATVWRRIGEVRRWGRRREGGDGLSVLDGAYGRGLRVSGAVLLVVIFFGVLLNLPFRSSDLETRHARASQLAALSGSEPGEGGVGAGPFGLRFGSPPDAVILEHVLTEPDGDPCALPPAASGTVLEKVAWVRPQLELRSYLARLDDRDIGLCGGFLEGTLALVVMPYNEFRFMEHALWRHLHEKYGSGDVERRRVVGASAADARRITATLSRGVFSDAALTIEMVKPVYTPSPAEEALQRQRSYLLYTDNRRMTVLSTMAAEAARAAEAAASGEYDQLIRERARMLRKF